ncbi:MAG: GIY-YIG nuclease family protein [Paludibacteraceae bacterium]|nr:GIY-YIG nuclease family protein [Paludibacteraceae bacterium]
MAFSTNKDGIVYLICDADKGLYKIGVTRKTAENRISSLQTGNASELFTIRRYPTNHPFRMETMLHNRFSAKHVMGEWFALTDDDVICFSDTCREIDRIIDSLSENPFFTPNIV